MAVQLGDASTNDVRQFRLEGPDTDWQDGEIHHLLGAIHDETSGIFVVDGREIVPTDVQGSASAHTVASGHGYRILGDCNGGSDELDGQVWMFNVWNRPLNRPELLARASDPLGLFRDASTFSARAEAGPAPRRPVVIAIST